VAAIDGVGDANHLGISGRAGWDRSRRSFHFDIGEAFFWRGCAFKAASASAAAVMVRDEAHVDPWRRHGPGRMVFATRGPV